MNKRLSRADLATFSLSREAQEAIMRIAENKKVYLSTVVELAVLELDRRLKKEVSPTAP